MFKYTDNANLLVPEQTDVSLYDEVVDVVDRDRRN